MNGTRARRRVPEHVSTQIRKVEPVGGDMVRLYFAIERDGTWDDQVTVLMPSASIPAASGFAVTSAREISAEAAGVVPQTAH
jgi:hypothetical protein